MLKLKIKYKKNGQTYSSQFFQLLVSISFEFFIPDYLAKPKLILGARQISRINIVYQRNIDCQMSGMSHVYSDVTRETRFVYPIF